MQAADKVRATENVILIVQRKDGRIERYIGNNIVGDEGDKHYAQRGAAEAPTNAFGTLELGTAGAAPGKTSDRSNMTTKIASSQKAASGGYPKTNDVDADNSGGGVDVVTWKFEYTKGEITGTAIDRAIITNTSPGASEPVLTYFTFAASFNLTADDQLKAVFVNHTLNGV